MSNFLTPVLQKQAGICGALLLSYDFDNIVKSNLIVDAVEENCGEATCISSL